MNMTFDPATLTDSDMETIRSFIDRTVSPFRDWLAFVVNEPGQWEWPIWSRPADAAQVGQAVAVFVNHSRYVGSETLIAFADWCHLMTTLVLASMVNTIMGLSEDAA